MQLQLSQEIRDRLNAAIPEGRRVEDVRLVNFTGRIEIAEDDSLTAEEQTLLANESKRVLQAGGPPMLSNGVPTVMRLVAWMAHEGRNNNGLIFLADDLGPAADRIREPNFLLMDWNHSAVLPFSFEPKAIGLWYRAEKRWDPKAKDGKGAYGILAHGIVWSWAFPEIANEMLADQERKGQLDFSMACIPRPLEMMEDGEVAHDPVFLTLSGLTVKPADRDATGRGVEGSDDPNLEQKLTEQLLATEEALPQAAAERVPQMTEEQMDELKTEIAALQAQLAGLTAEATKRQEAETALTAATAEIEGLKTKITELEVKNESLVAEAEAEKQKAAQVQEKLVAAEEKLAAIQAAEETKQVEDRWIARKAQLPKSYLEKLEARTDEEKTRFENKWKAASDEAWKEFTSDLAVAFASVGATGPDYVALSQQEGGALPQGAPASDDIADLVSSIRKGR